jgi:hypothetical protein
MDAQFRSICALWEQENTAGARRAPSSRGRRDPSSCGLGAHRQPTLVQERGPAGLARSCFVTTSTRMRGSTELRDWRGGPSTLRARHESAIAGVRHPRCNRSARRWDFRLSIAVTICEAVRGCAPQTRSAQLITDHLGRANVFGHPAVVTTWASPGSLLHLFQPLIGLRMAIAG